MNYNGLFEFRHSEMQLGDSMCHLLIFFVVSPRILLDLSVSAIYMKLWMTRPRKGNYLGIYTANILKRLEEPT